MGRWSCVEEWRGLKVKFCGVFYSSLWMGSFCDDPSVSRQKGYLNNARGARLQCHMSLDA